MRKRKKVLRTLWATGVGLYIVAMSNTHLDHEFQARAPSSNLVRFMMLRDARKRELVRAMSIRSRRLVILH